MNDSNKNENPQPEKVRLVFDVMPREGFETSNEDASADSQPLSSQTTMPKVAEPPPLPEKLPPVMPPPPDDFGKPARFKMPAFHLPTIHFNMKWLIIAAVLAVLGVGGYFGYRYYQNSILTPLDENLLISQRPGDNIADSMPESWLVKYFGQVDCEVSLCGPSADPDNDSLTNSKEQEYGTDPQNADSDYDGLADSDEVQVYNTDPVVSDTDGDGFEDGSEVRNGYSPTVAVSQPVSMVEKQVTEDNIQNFGLHELTQMFLAMSLNKISFDSATGTATTLNVSLPGGWTQLQQANLAIIKSPDATSTLQILLSPDNPADDTNLMALWQTVTDFSAGGTDLGQSVEKAGNLTIHTSEYRIFTDDAQTTQYHALRAMFIKQDRLFDAVFMTPDANWPNVEDEARIIIHSIR